MVKPPLHPARHPRFIHRSPGLALRPPFIQKNSRMYGFFVEGQKKSIQQLIDQQVNMVAAGQQYFKALSDYVMIAFTHIDQAYAINSVDKAKGWGSEIDTAVWIPVGSFSEKDGKHYLNKLYWYIPNIWVDSPIASIIGREIYGYPKTIARFNFPDSKNPNHFGLTVSGHKYFDQDDPIQWHELLTIKNHCPSPCQDSEWEHFAQAIAGIGHVIGDILPPFLDWNISKETLRSFLKPEVPQLFLKQLPDGNLQHAVYQALMHAPAQIKAFHGGGILNGDYEVTINQLASEPLAQELGITSNSQQAAFGFWLNFDFELPEAQVVIDNSIVKPEKIAILGGGISSLTTAFALTNQPGWQNHYEITVYQQGWRLGGKGASGRNMEQGARIEEHGLHIWFGFYRNAFNVIQQVYEELNRPEGAKLRSWEDAFKPHNFIVQMEHIKGEWIPWFLNFPYKEGNPGEGTESLSVWKLSQTIYSFVRQWLGDLREELSSIEEQEKACEQPARSRKEFSFTERLRELSDWIDDEIQEARDELEQVINGLINFVDSLPDNINEHRSQDHSWLQAILEEIKEWLEEYTSDLLEEHHTLRRLYIGVDLGLTVLIGMIRDDIFSKGFDEINHLDFREWLNKHNASERFTIDSAAIRAVYDLVFGYEDGNINTPNVEAGTMLRGMLRLGICYTGGVMWKMQAGMGDAMFTPFYEVLKQRGVTFRFFHEIKELRLDPDNPQQIKHIDVIQQVDVSKGADSYHPLIDVKGSGCWPSAPLYEQLDPVQAKLLREHKVNLECFWSHWPEVYSEHYSRPLKQLTLNHREDFDTIVFGISIASIPFLCPELLEHSEALTNTCKYVKTTATQAYQLWTNDSLEELGWTHTSDSGEEPVLGAWTEPVDTWAAMNQLLAEEEWGNTGFDPKNVAYFCGVQPVTDIPPRTDYEFPHKCTYEVKKAAIDQLNSDIYSLWPKAATKGHFNWKVLTGDQSLSGEDRFDTQYWRSNVSPSERYVLSVVGSSKYRINTKLNEFNNIYFTGDWIQNGLNAGCVEGATMAGLQTSRAICGHPKVIRGEFDFGNPDL